METGGQRPLIAVVGPTGAGKSDLALVIAEKFQGEIVNCDSLQVYRHFDLGTAKVPVTERRGIPHHLLDIADPDQLFTAGDYARAARAALDEISARGRLPVLVGGTGFYLSALLVGLFEGPERDALLRANLSEREVRRPGAMHRILRRLDPDAAKRIHPNDRNKVMRAVEICVLARAPLSELFQTGREPLTGYRTQKLGLNPSRARLYETLDERMRGMFDAGLCDEVRRILSLGYSPSAKPFESIGYKQALALVLGQMTEEQAVTDAQRETRRYSKRQMTWFRRDETIVWFEGFGSEPAIQEAALETICR